MKSSKFRSFSDSLLKSDSESLKLRYSDDFTRKKVTLKTPNGYLYWVLQLQTFYLFQPHVSKTGKYKIAMSDLHVGRQLRCVVIARQEIAKVTSPSIIINPTSQPSQLLFFLYTHASYEHRQPPNPTTCNSIHSHTHSHQDFQASSPPLSTFTFAPRYSNKQHGDQQ